MIGVWVLATGLVFAALGWWALVDGGRIRLLHVFTEPGRRAAEMISARVPRSSERWRAEARLARARYRCWRRGW